MIGSIKYIWLLPLVLFLLISSCKEVAKVNRNSSILHAQDFILKRNMILRNELKSNIRERGNRPTDLVFYNETGTLIEYDIDSFSEGIDVQLLKSVIEDYLKRIESSDVYDKEEFLTSKSSLIESLNEFLTVTSLANYNNLLIQIYLMDNLILENANGKIGVLTSDNIYIKIYSNSDTIIKDQVQIMVIKFESKIEDFNFKNIHLDVKNNAINLQDVHLEYITKGMWILEFRPIKTGSCEIFFSTELSNKYDQEAISIGISEQKNFVVKH
jgi:hypothetical protein